MRILHIIGSMDPSSGGPCQGIRNSASLLEQINVYREVVCFDDPDSPYLGSDIFPVTALGKGISSWHYNPKFVPWLENNLHRFDAIITNGLWLYHSTALRRVIGRLKKHAQVDTVIPKVFVMPHGMLDPYFQRAPSRKVKALRNWLYWQLLERDVVSQADGLLFTCETEMLLARETFKPYHPQREINIGYGVDAPPAYTESMRQAFLEKCPYVAGKPYLLFLSRIHAKKGTDLLVKAYATVTDSLASQGGPALPALVIAGPGLDSTYGKSIYEFVQQNSGRSLPVYFPGMLTGDAKWGAFYGCDAFILPSHQENFGIAVAEALACGKPVLISDQVNIWREIETEGGGFVAPDTLKGTIHLLQRWVDLQSQDKQAMTGNATFTFEQHFSIEPAARRFKEAIT